MKIYINLERLEELDLTPSLYCYLHTLHYNEPYNLASIALQKIMDTKLQELGYLKITPEGIVLRKQTTKLFKESIPWIDDWRNLFPKGIKSGNRPIRGDKQGVLKKMQTFIKEHPNYSKEQVFEATKQYVYDCGLKNYQFMICADYFIDKNNNSVLGAVIEDITDNGSSLKSMSEGGGSNWHKEI